MIFSIMTFNVRVHVPSDGLNAWPYRVEKLATLINQEHPMIIGTQEMLPSMIKELDGKLTDYDWFGKPRRRDDEYSAIFYRKDKFKVLNHGTFWLSETPAVEGSISWNSNFPRVCTWGEFESIENPHCKFRVFNTHLDHISEEARSKGVHVILHFINQLREKENLPIILMGDFNAFPNSHAVQFLQEDAQFINAYSKIDLDEHLRKTYHDFKGGIEGEPIDYIFTSPNIEIIKAEIIHKTVDNMYPSDHYPVTALIKVLTIQ
jgi:endonuclease/exonuclease/phosphatase family metal-dependent hydrolase